jgi:competence protein ComEC
VLKDRAPLEGSSVDVDVVKVPHHGSANLDPGFSEWAEPEIALISVGEVNDYGHPARAAIDQWGGARI